MIRHFAQPLCAALRLLLAAPAVGAESVAARAAWAHALIASDITPTTGGRAAIARRRHRRSPCASRSRRRAAALRASSATISAATPARSPCAASPAIRPPAGGSGAQTRRASRKSPPRNAPRSPLSRAPPSASRAASAAPTKSCPAGEQAYLELAVEGRATSLSRACVANTDAGGRLALRLSELAGSRTEEELAAAAVAELLAADRAFAAKAAADGVPAAFTEYAAEDALIVTSDAITTGRAGIATRSPNWPQARVSNGRRKRPRLRARRHGLDLGQFRLHRAGRHAHAPAATSRCGRATTKATGATPSTRRSASRANPPSAKNCSSSGVLLRPRIALRCGKRPKRAMMSRCRIAYFVNSRSPIASTSVTARSCSARSSACSNGM